MYLRKITYVNTCAYDSITEVLSSGICNITNFKIFIESNKNTIIHSRNILYARALINFSVSGPGVSAYTDRAYLLHSLIPPVNDTINCATNVTNLFSQLMINLYSYLEIRTCTCGKKQELKKYVLPIPNTNIVTKYKYKNLESAVNDYFSGKIVYCDSCESTSSRIAYNIRSYLYVDVEDAYKQQLNSQLEKKPILTELTEIPYKIIIQSELFILCGVIRYKPSVIPNGMGHYIAYCRSIKGIWDERDDLCNIKVNIVKNRSLMQISALIYAKF